MITSYLKLDDLIDEIFNEHEDKVVITPIDDKHMNISKANGYKIFKITIDPEDPYFEPDDFQCETYHGLRIYTYLSNQFKDCKSIVAPIYEFDTSAIGDTSQVNYVLEDYQYDKNIFNVYIGNGYINIMVYGQDLADFHEYHYGKVSLAIISDGMYHKRNHALETLLSIVEAE